MALLFRLAHKTAHKALQTLRVLTPRESETKKKARTGRGHTRVRERVRVPRLCEAETRSVSGTERVGASRGRADF